MCQIMCYVLDYVSNKCIIVLDYVSNKCFIALNHTNEWPPRPQVMTSCNLFLTVKKLYLHFLSQYLVEICIKVTKKNYVFICNPGILEYLDMKIPELRDFHLLPAQEALGLFAYIQGPTRQAAAFQTLIIKNETMHFNYDDITKFLGKISFFKDVGKSVFLILHYTS